MWPFCPPEGGRGGAGGDGGLGIGGGGGGGLVIGGGGAGGLGIGGGGDGGTSGGGGEGGGGDGGGGTNGNGSENPEEPSQPDEDNNEDEDGDDNNSELQSSSATSTSSSAASTSSLAASSSASSAIASQLCSPSCAACIAPPTKLKMPRRGLSERALNAPAKSLSKRRMTTPADYGGDVGQFLLLEYAWAEWLPISSPTQGASVGFIRLLTNQRYDAAVGGLFGCTVVVVVSQSVMWMAHFWEIPAFRHTARGRPSTRTQADVHEFRERVIRQMQYGGQYIPGLVQYTYPDGVFHMSQRPVWTILTPRDVYGIPDTWLYEPEINEIRGVLHNLFPNTPDVVIDYKSRDDFNDQAGTASGKVLFQYDPFERVAPSSHDPCVGCQQAAFRLWVEDRPQSVWQRYWNANPQQRVANPSNYKGKRKRDGPACELPSELPQAPRESKGIEPTSNNAPDSEVTHWITLGASAGATNAASSSNGSTALATSSEPTLTTGGSINNSSATPTATSAPDCTANEDPLYSPTS